MMTAENAYVELVEKIFGASLPNCDDGILVGATMLTLRRVWGDQPPAIFDCLDRELTAAVRIVRKRDAKETSRSCIIIH